MMIAWSSAKAPLVVKRAVELSGRGDLRFHVHEPSGFKDWVTNCEDGIQLPLCSGRRSLPAPENSLW
jgi:hypothetical protein